MVWYHQAYELWWTTPDSKIHGANGPIWGRQGLYINIWDMSKNILGTGIYSKIDNKWLRTNFTPTNTLYKCTELKGFCTFWLKVKTCREHIRRSMICPQNKMMLQLIFIWCHGSWRQPFISLHRISSLKVKRNSLPRFGAGYVTWHTYLS